MSAAREHRARLRAGARSAFVPLPDCPPARALLALALAALTCGAPLVFADAAPHGEGHGPGQRPALGPAEPSGEVERELIARAIALGHLEHARVARLLESADWTLRHLALDALGRSERARGFARAHGAAVRAALDDPRPELRIAALRALDAATLAAATLARLARDDSPEVRLALARALCAARGDAVFAALARMAEGDDEAARVAQRALIVAGQLGAVFDAGGGPSSQVAGSQVAGLQVGGSQVAGSQVAGATTAHGPWATVATLFEELVALPDSERAVLAEALIARSADPAQRALALALLAHARPLDPEDAQRFVDSAPALFEAYGEDGALAVLRRVARLGERGPAGGLARLADAGAVSLDAATRAALLEVAVEGMSSAALVALPFEPRADDGAASQQPAPLQPAPLQPAPLQPAPLDLTLAALRALLARGAVVEPEALARLADARSIDVRGAALTFAEDALSTGRAAVALPLLMRLLDDPNPALASDAFRALARSEAPLAAAREVEGALYRAWRAAAPRERVTRLRALARTRRWPSFVTELSAYAETSHDPAYIGLLAPLADERGSARPSSVGLQRTSLRSRRPTASSSGSSLTGARRRWRSRWRGRATPWAGRALTSRLRCCW
ncbi:MAG: hypothetical protein R3F49_12265 [Planctomycetota bacterium]